MRRIADSNRWWIAGAVVTVVLAVAGAALYVLVWDDEPTPAEEATGGRFGGDADRDGIRDGSLTSEQAADGPDEDQLIVSIGDSVASGEGNPDRAGDFPTRRERWLLRRCHRSLRSGHAEAALQAERDDPEVDVAFVALACSGATIEEGLLGPYRGIQPERGDLLEPAQVARVNALAERREIDLLLVGVGANDVHFSSIVKFCLAVRDCPEQRFDPRRPFGEAPRGTPTLREVVDDELRRMGGRYAALDRELSDRIPRDRVVLVEYFDPTRAPAGRGGGRPPEGFCRVAFLNGEITPDESRWARREVLEPLNAAVAAAGRDHGWRVVDGVDEAFAAHGICARPDGERWVRTLPESLHRQGLDFSGTLHPNRLGHEATARSMRLAVADVLGLDATGSR